MTFSIPKNTHERPIAIVGAGTMGREIALTYAGNGATVNLNDNSDKSLKSAKEFIDKELPSLIAKTGKKGGSVNFFGELQPALKNSWYIIETIPEIRDAKIDMLGKLDELAEDDAMIGTNSSSFMSSELIGKVKNKNRVLNTHYGQPPKYPQLELMTDGSTDQDILDFLATELAKYGFVTGVARKQSVGLIINRVWAAIKRESLAVVAEGVSTPQEFDRLWVASGMGSVGVFRLIDKVGLDVALDIENNYLAHFSYIPTKSRDLLQKYVDAGKLGVKSGEGFYNDYKKPAAS